MLRNVLSLFLALVLLTGTTVAGHQELADATNAYRISLGLTPLTIDSTLDDFASQRAVEIVSYFSHQYWWSEQVCWKAMGENLAMANDAIIQPTGLSIQDYFINLWSNSPDHNKNMTGNYTHIGTAIHTVEDTHFAVQIFWLPCDAGSPVPPTPAPMIEPISLTMLPDTRTTP
jgi:uncharacterized protein YkwD